MLRFDLLGREKGEERTDASSEASRQTELTLYLPCVVFWEHEQILISKMEALEKAKTEVLKLELEVSSLLVSFRWGNESETKDRPS